jgi:hypothetical protein
MGILDEAFNGRTANGNVDERVLYQMHQALMAMAPFIFISTIFDSNRLARWVPYKKSRLSSSRAALVAPSLAWRSTPIGGD